MIELAVATGWPPSALRELDDDELATVVDVLAAARSRRGD